MPDDDELLVELSEESEAETEPEGEEVPKPDPEPDAEAPEFQSINELLPEGKSLDDLYKGYGFGLPEDLGSFTLEEVKTRAAELVKADQFKADLEDQRASFAADSARTTRRLQAIIGSLPEGSVSEEMVKKADEDFNTYLADERTAMLKARPDWQGKEAYAAVVDTVRKVAEPYGFSKAELNSVTDHRFWLMGHRLAELENRITNAKRVDPPKPNIDSVGAKRKAKQPKITGMTPELGALLGE